MIVTCRVKHPGNKQQGFTLLEVLIALLVLSIGLLGLAALQTTGLRSNQMATMRTLATQIAYDMTDRMRANPTGVASGQYIIATTATPTDPPVTRADIDLTEWRVQVARLPGGLSRITQTAGPPVTHVITVFWDEERKGATLEGADGNCPPADNSELRCLRLTM
jgi:type IV pilus assembly protein PilV